MKKSIPYSKTENRTNSIQWTKLLLCVFTSWMLSACSDAPGGGGIGGSGKIVPTPDSGLLIGQVSSVGVLTIGGTRVNTDQATIVVNGDSGTVSDIQIGMPVTVEADAEEFSVESDAIVATKIEYQALLAGPVDTVSVDQTSMTIFGQSVLINENTYMDQVTIEDIFEGQEFEVSGARDDSNAIHADYIRAHSLTDSKFLVGQFDDRDIDIELVTISETPVDFRPLLESTNSSIGSEILPGSTLYVELDSRESPTDPLVATYAAVLSEISSNKYETIVVNGAISQIRDTDIFKIRNVHFRTTDETVFRNNAGAVIDPLAVEGIDVAKVSGTLLSDGVVLATNITVRKMKSR